MNIFNVIYEHCGSDKFIIENFNYPTNRPFGAIRNKPYGGLWGSPVNSNNNWKNWCIVEHFYTDRLNKSFKFKLKENSKVLILETKEDLDYLLYNELAWHSLNFGLSLVIDFEKLIEQKYDAIVFYVENLYYELYGWDCDSVLVLNPDCMELL